MGTEEEKEEERGIGRTLACVEPRWLPKEVDRKGQSKK